jgi:predicted DCC family thiol-disulfide oxidoreductase YuxK
MADNIILFDGFCNFCSSSVIFILKRDKQSYFHFASLQSATGNKIFMKGINTNPLESIMLLEKGNYYYFSSAALRIARKLAFPWNLFYAFIIIPRFLRDPVYKLVAAKRYKWFGKRESCFIPSEKDKARFTIN